jgi:CRISPR system Cascade subunit CasD
MSTLLLRLAAPLQSWGSDSKFSRRTTNREPTKSGVIGLAACALGRKRTDSIEDLAALKFAARVDQPGTQIRDFHVARKEWGTATSPFLSERYYLADAIFLVGLEASDELLLTVDTALRNPAFPLFLGRRSCPPVAPISLGIRKGIGLLDALADEPWQASEWYQKKYPNVDNLEIFFDAVVDIDGNSKGEYLQRDHPITFDQGYRKYDFRKVKRSRVPNPYFRDAAGDIPINEDEEAEFHDPMEIT